MSMIRQLSCFSVRRTEDSAYEPGMEPITSRGMLNGNFTKIQSSTRSVGSGASSSSESSELADDVAELFLSCDGQSKQYPMGIRVRLSEDEVDGLPEEPNSEPNGMLVDEVDFASCGYGLGLTKGDRLVKVNGQHLPLPDRKRIVISVTGTLIKLEIEKRVRCPRSGEWRHQTSIVDNTITVSVAETHECPDNSLRKDNAVEYYIRSDQPKVYMAYMNSELVFKTRMTGAEKRTHATFRVFSLSEVNADNSAVAVIIQHKDTGKCLYLTNQGTVGVMDVDMDSKNDFSSHEPYVFKKRSYRVGTRNFTFESYSSQCRTGTTMMLGCGRDGSSWKAVGVDAATPGDVRTAFSVMSPRH